ncbi:MAG: hypothetical protein GYA21_12920 [Myxococcales bacterium]|nr:hypothetical protein [Myxococcales bacterium]
MKPKFAARSLWRAAVGMLFFLVATCGGDSHTGVWVRILTGDDLEGNPIKVRWVRVQVFEPGNATTPVASIDRDLPQDMALPAGATDPSLQFWVLVLASRDIDESVTVVARGYRKGAAGCANDPEVASGVRTYQFEKGKVVDDLIGLTMTHLGTDADSDGYFTPADCDDNDANVNPCAREVCFDNLDNDCDEDGSVDEDCPCTAGESRECWPHWAAEPRGGPCQKGTQTCSNGSWGTCVGAVLPKPEFCYDGGFSCLDGAGQPLCHNGIDDDCDGVTDDRDPGQRGAVAGQDTGCGGCFDGDVKTCWTGPPDRQRLPCRDGMSNCVSGRWSSCAGQVLPLGFETYTDLNGNGQFDAGEDFLDLDANGQRDAGEPSTDDNPPNGQRDETPSEYDLCDCLDNDCNGVIDDTQPKFCSNQMGVCAGALQRCDSQACVWVDCATDDYLASANNTLCQGAAQPECCSRNPQDCYLAAAQETAAYCDDLDNNCDGAPDNAGFLPDNRPVCQCPNGAEKTCPEIANPDEGECVRGVFRCIDGSYLAQPGCIQPEPNERCDNKDNDCDGQTDGFLVADCPIQPWTLFSGCTGGVCNYLCVEDHHDLNQNRNVSGGSPANDGCEYPCHITSATERCDGQDNNCDGATDERQGEITLLCPLPPQSPERVVVTACTAPGRCDYTCRNPFADCNNDLNPVPGIGQTDNRNGCEKNLSNDPLNCASCGRVCGSHGLCVGGQCQCETGWADCNGDLGQATTNGCETQLGTVSNCLSCGDSCDDSNECTNNECDAMSGCYFPNKPDGTACGTGNCTGCTNGVCGQYSAMCQGNCSRCNGSGTNYSCVANDSSCTGNCDACNGSGTTFNCAANSALCTGNCDVCNGSGTSFNCAASDALCTGNCDVCSGSGTSFNCAASDALCTGNCDVCSGSGTSFNCAANNAACTGNCDVCSGSGTTYNCQANPGDCAGNCVQCTGSGTAFNCTANNTVCSGNCDVCNGSGTTFNCAADNALCTGNCDVCNGSGTSFNCAANDSACTGNCDVCNGSGTSFNCAANDSACTGNCDVCSGSGTSFNCAASDALCTGNCDVCSGSGTSFNCAASDTLCTGNCDTCSGSGNTFNCQATPSDCSGNCVQCTGSGTAYNCSARSSDCSGNCAQCTGSGTTYNCSGNSSACTGNCDVCSGSGTTWNCAANPGDCSGNCVQCTGSGTAYNCSARSSDCSGNCPQCTGSGTTYNCSANNSACTGNCDVCSGSGTTWNCAANPGDCSGNCVQCTGSGTAFNCGANSSACSGDCPQCSGSGTTYNCAANNSLCTAECDVCSGSGTTWNCTFDNAQCDTNETCYSGVCHCGSSSGPNCAGTAADFCCPPSCVDTTSDSANCGGCGVSCATNQAGHACVSSNCGCLNASHCDATTYGLKCRSNNICGCDNDGDCSTGTCNTINHRCV